MCVCVGGGGGEGRREEGAKSQVKKAETLTAIALCHCTMSSCLKFPTIKHNFYLHCYMNDRLEIYCE